jgi:hypothetical protein
MSTAPNYCPSLPETSGVIMTKSESQFPDQRIPEYNQHNERPSAMATQSDVKQVIVPPDPPEFGPAAARALLRLLLAVHRRRLNAPHDPVEDP